MPRDQKVLAHDPERPHEWFANTRIIDGQYHCDFCGTEGSGAHLFAYSSAVLICRACVRLALYKMAEIPETQQ